MQFRNVIVNRIKLELKGQITPVPSPFQITGFSEELSYHDLSNLLIKVTISM